MGLIIGLFIVVAIAAVIVWVADYTSVPRRRIEEIKKRLNDERRIS
jgi:cell division septal protein FtsQ